MSLATQKILIDTGPIVAIYDKRDQYHRACAELTRQLPPVVYTCWPVITEACYLLRRRQDLVEALLDAVYEGTYEVLDISVGEITQVGGLLAKFRDQQIDLADAAWFISRTVRRFPRSLLLMSVTSDSSGRQRANHCNWCLTCLASQKTRLQPLVENLNQKLADRR